MSTKTTTFDSSRLPLVDDNAGFVGPVKITSANPYNDSVILNFNFRTSKSVKKDGSITNATKTIKSEWSSYETFKSAKGMLVDVVIADGYVKAVYPAKAKPLSSKPAAPAVEQTEEEEASALNDLM